MRMKSAEVICQFQTRHSLKKHVVFLCLKIGGSEIPDFLSTFLAYGDKEKNWACGDYCGICFPRHNQYFTGTPMKPGKESH